MTQTTKRNQKVREYIISKIKMDGYTEDRYGNWKSKTGKYRYKFQSSSYRFELCVDSIKPKTWIKVSGNYYKNVKVS